MPPRSNILGVGVSAVSMDSAVDLTKQLIESGGRGYICVTGVHGVMEAQVDPAFKEILNRSFLTTPDGMPTVWVGRLQGHSISRVYGPDFMLNLCRASVELGYRHFLYGGKAGVATTLKEALEAKVPGIKVVGTYTPPFRALDEVEMKELQVLIAASRPHVMWVGLSTPKQERFMASILDNFEVPLMVGVGAAFDIHIGVVRDAPIWMKRAGLQWLHRLSQDYRRLWRRYLINNPRFVWQILLQLTGVRRYSL